MLFRFGYLLCFLVFSLSSSLRAEQKQTSACPCGCACKFDCKCHCQEGKPCTCASGKTEACPCGCACKFNCKCHCQEGKPCTCASGKTEACPCGCACKFNCKCHCQEGKECHCPKEKAEGCPCGCACKFNCQCDCQEGKGCHCSEKALPASESEFAYESDFDESSDLEDETEVYTDESQAIPYDVYHRYPTHVDTREGFPIISPMIPGIPCDDGCSWDDWRHFDKDGCLVVWLPEGPPLFRQFMANPRQVTYGAGWRFNDNVFTSNTGAVSFGDTCALYRHYKPWNFEGVAQVEVEGAIWALFEQTSPSAPLVNTDYYVGIPLTYAIDCWSFRLRPYHISSHIGDEFLLANEGFDRRNASAEYIDFSASYHWTPDIRLFGVVGVVVRSDPSFRMKKWYFQYGAESYFSVLGFYNKCQNILGRPYVALFVQQWEDNGFQLDSTVAVGYEWHKVCGLCRNLRIFAEYHSGFSPEGQFCRLHNSWVSFNISYGY